jgi:hypothetical protein
MYDLILRETPFLLQEDEIRVRGRLGALALAEGREDDAREAFGQVLQISSDWIPSAEDFSPSVRSFVEEMQAEADADAAAAAAEAEAEGQGGGQLRWC